MTEQELVLSEMLTIEKNVNDGLKLALAQANAQAKVLAEQLRQATEKLKMQEEELRKERNDQPAREGAELIS